MNHVVNNITGLDASSNEYRVKYVVQRIINRLFENDVALKSLYNTIFSNVSIYEWHEGDTYEYGDVVWFLDAERELHVLRCDMTKSSENLMAYNPTINKFEDFGWKDLNPSIDILENYGFRSKIEMYVAKLFKQHSENPDMHKYGKLSYSTDSKNSIDLKLANRKVSNLNAQRDGFFFPYQTITLKPNNSIVDGFCRRYDNGLLEYDIIFRLGYAGFKEVDSEYKLSANVYECNNLDLSLDHTQDKYFYQASDMNIFTSPVCDNKYEFEYQQTVQKNRNDYVNVYHATLNFADCANMGVSRTLYEFYDTNYMVFCSDVMAQSRSISNQALNISPNAMTFCQKQKGSITAILVTYPNANNFETPGINGRNTGLLQNTFHCKIIGKCRVIG